MVFGRAARMAQMAHILHFDRVFCGLKREAGAVADARPELNDFWPDVQCSLCPPVDPANAPRRVLAEMALALAGSGLAVGLLSLLVAGRALP